MTIRLSPRELQALIGGALDAVAGGALHSDAAACDLTWLQARGFEVLRDAADTVAAGALAAPKVSSEADGTLAMDCDHAAPPIACLVARDLAFSGHDRVYLHALHRPEHLIRTVARCAAANVTATAWWHSNDLVHAAWCEAGAVEPEYRTWSMGSQTWPTQLTLAPPDGPAPVVPTTGLAGCIAPADFRRRYERALNRGIEIDHGTYAQLRDQAASRLVAISDASRRGAGE